MKYYVVDDSKAVVQSIAKMVEDKGFGSVVGRNTDACAAVDEIVAEHPDIVIVDYLMPEMDGVELVELVKKRAPEICFVMLSKVDDKKMVAKAYEAGIEFFMSKPVSIIEANRVLGNVAEKIKMKRIVNGIHDVLGGDSRSAGVEKLKEVAAGTLKEAGLAGPTEEDLEMADKMHRVDILLGSIDMRNQKGSAFIKLLIEMMCERNCDYDKDMLNELSEKTGVSLKNIEQQIRRAIKRGLENAARIGLSDFDNEVFVVYANYVFDFVCLREEMNYIQGISKTGGRVSISGFMNGLKLYVECS